MKSPNYILQGWLEPRSATIAHAGTMLSNEVQLEYFPNILNQVMGDYLENKLSRKDVHIEGQAHTIVARKVLLKEVFEFFQMLVKNERTTSMEHKSTFARLHPCGCTGQAGLIRNKTPDANVFLDTANRALVIPTPLFSTLVKMAEAGEITISPNYTTVRA